MPRLISILKETTIKDLFKKGWVLYPEIMSAHALSGLALIAMGIFSYVHRDYVHIPKTFERPVYLRPQDPRARKTLTFYEDGWDEKYPA